MTLIPTIVADAVHQEHEDNLQELEESLKRLLKKLFPALPTGKYKGILRLSSDIILPSLVYFYYQQNSTKNFFDYIDSLTPKRVKEQMPVAADLLSHFVRLLKEDTKRLDLKNKTVEIKGDLHNEGGTKYKNREWMVFGKYPDYYNLFQSVGHLLPEVFLKTQPETIKKGSITYRKFVKANLHATSENEVEEYYLNLGRTLPVLVLFRVIDLYSENAIVTLPYPTYFDMECFFTPKFLRAPSYSIKQSGILKTGQEEDVSTLTGGTEQIKSYLRPHLFGSEQEPEIRWIVPMDLEVQNIPFLNDERVNPARYFDQILAGYKEGEEIIKGNLEKIVEVVTNTPTTIRILPRKTATYKSLIQKFLFPNIYLDIPNPKSFFMKELKNRDTFYEFTDSNSLLQYEVDSLSKGFIPVTYCEIHKKDIFSPLGENVASFTEAPIKTWEQHISNKNLFEQQFQILGEELGKAKLLSQI